MANLLSKISIGWDYAWWFPSIYFLLTLIMVLIFGIKFAKKFFHIPSAKSIKEKMPFMLSAAVFGRGLMILSIFIPLSLGTIWFWIGILIFVVGALFTTIAMINFAKTPQGQPVTRGIYQYSRHPILVLAIIMWIGVGLATTSWIIVTPCGLLTLLSYSSFIAQEKFCRQRYGETYQEYLNSTPRVFRFYKSD